MDSPVIEKKYSSASQKYVGPSSAINQQTIQRHNFLMPKEDQLSRVQLQKKSSSPISFPQQRFDNNLNISPY
jgi:hypothetical protein